MCINYKAQSHKVSHRSSNTNVVPSMVWRCTFTRFRLNVIEVQKKSICRCFSVVVFRCNPVQWMDFVFYFLCLLLFLWFLLKRVFYCENYAKNKESFHLECVSIVRYFLFIEITMRVLCLMNSGKFPTIDSSFYIVLYSSTFEFRDGVNHLKEQIQ